MGRLNMVKNKRYGQRFRDKIIQTMVYGEMGFKFSKNPLILYLVVEAT